MKRNQKVQKNVLQREASTFPNIAPKTENQRLFVDHLKYNSLVIADGPAGTGKTLLSVFKAAKALHTRLVKKVVLIRAYQPLAGRSIGFLPGTAEEKLLPYYQQMIDYFEDILGKAVVEIHLKNKSIEICSLETIRGRSWDDCIVIVDESQNLYPEEVRALCTRIGDNCQMLLIGDDSGVQSDVKNKVNGLSFLKGIVEKYNIEGVASVTFTYDDILRSNITKSFVIAFDKEMQEGKPTNNATPKKGSR